MWFWELSKVFLMDLENTCFGSSLPVFDCVALKCLKHGLKIGKGIEK